MNLEDIPIGLRINDDRRRTAQGSTGEIQGQRQTKWTEEHTRLIKEWARQGISEIEMSKRLGVASTTVNAHMSEIKTAEENR